MTDPFGGICYKKTFLKEVIARVDLLSPLPGVATALPPPLAEVAVKAFPIPEPHEAVQLQIGPQGAVAPTEARFTEWHFHGKERTKKLTIGSKVVLVQHQVYETYELLRDEFLSIVARVAELFQGTQHSRVGLRYVNAIDLDEPKPIDWSGYLNPSLLSLFSFPPETDRPSLSRVFHNVELAFDAFSLRYRLGMHNPDYPAPIRQKVFVLDLDAYTQSAGDIGRLGPLLDQLHATIQSYFEKSVTDALRRLMHAE